MIECENKNVREVSEGQAYGGQRPPPHPLGSHLVDDVDLWRGREYDLLAALLGRAPDASLLTAIAQIEGDASPLGRAHQDLAGAARTADPDATSREFFDLFIGLGRGELLPYASYYQTGFLQERPLARVRDDLAALGIERAERQTEPEDHVAILLEIMAGLATGRFGTEPGSDSRFFDRHLKPWVERFLTDLERSPSARFYRRVGALGRLFIEVETEAFALPG